MCLHPKPWLLARSLVLAKDLRLGARPIERDDAASTKSKPIRWNGPMGVFEMAAFEGQRPLCFCTSVFEGCYLGWCGYFAGLKVDLQMQVLQANMHTLLTPSSMAPSMASTT